MIAIECFTAAEAQAHITSQAILQLYEVTYAAAPYDGQPPYTAGTFRERMLRQAAAPDFTLALARCTQNTLRGFAVGLHMAPGTWWNGATAAPPPILQAGKYAVLELVVGPEHRDQGIGDQLLSELLAHRQERYATLLTEPKAPAYHYFMRRGFQPIATAGRATVMVRSLNASQTV